MADIVIKKRVSLEFLGEEYKDSYLTFKSISLTDQTVFEENIKKLGDDSKKVNQELIQQLQDRFIEGLFQGQKVEPEDIKQLDAESVVKCYQSFTGDLDPKVSEQ
jgi:hypothetical protein